MTARIDLARETGRHYPGEVVTGSVEWSFPAVPRDAAMVLRWRAEGKGDPDGGVVSTERFADLQALDRRTFRLALPRMPYSFSGTVLSIVWVVELVVRFRLRPQKIEVSRLVTMSPTGDPIDPYRR